VPISLRRSAQAFDVQLLIFSFDRASREKAEKTINSLVSERLSMDEKYVPVAV
jgi:hypothetical protein